MTVKSSIDGEEDTTDTMAMRIASVQSESWRNYRYIDEDSAEAWDAFHENLFVRSGDGMEEDEEDLKNKVPALVSKFDDLEYLDTISAPLDAVTLSRSKKIRRDRKRNRAKTTAKGDPEDEAESDASSTLSDSASDTNSGEDGTVL